MYRANIVITNTAALAYGFSGKIVAYFHMFLRFLLIFAENS